MKGKPLLVGFAAFVIVLLGGAAIAGIGLQRDVVGDMPSTYALSGQEATTGSEAPKPTVTMTTASLKTEIVSEKEKPSSEAKTDVPDKAKHEDDEETKSDDAKDQDPAFTITRPADGTHLTSKVIAFGRSVADGSTVHRGKNEAKLQEGEWAMELVLSPGKNHVSFEAISDDGQTTTASVTVYFDAPREDEKDRSDDSETSLTALQKYGSCGEEVPYDVFYGTAKPGVNITASSEYGSNSTTAIDSGRWEMKVTFPDSPQGKTFDVKIRSSTSQYETFSFTNTGSGKDH
jgi:hypothetical protein